MVVGLVAVVEVIDFSVVVGAAVAVLLCVGEEFVLLFGPLVSSEVGGIEAVVVSVCPGALVVGDVVSVLEVVGAAVADVGVCPVAVGVCVVALMVVNGIVFSEVIGLVVVTMLLVVRVMVAVRAVATFVVVCPGALVVCVVAPIVVVDGLVSMVIGVNVVATLRVVGEVMVGRLVVVAEVGGSAYET